MMILRIESKLISFTGRKGPGSNRRRQDERIALPVAYGKDDMESIQLSDPAVLGAMQSSDATVPAIYNVQNSATPALPSQLSKTNSRMILAKETKVLFH